MEARSKSHKVSPTSVTEAEAKGLRYTRESGGARQQGWVVKEGKTMKLHAPRWLSLQGSELRNHKEPGAKPTWTISIKDCAVGPGPRKNELLVNLPKRKVSFFTSNAEDFEAWIFALKKASSSDFNLTAFYRIGDVIGEGVNGEVHIGWDRVTNEAVAIKSIPYEGEMSAMNDPEAESEIAIVKSLNHHAVVKTYDVFRDSEKKRVYMVMEYVQGGELFARVANETGSLVREGDAIRVARDLFEAVIYLHAQSVVHRDIKLENILCICEDQTKPIHVKLADFGLSSSLTGRDVSMSSLVGTSYYLAPEIITKGGYGPAVDFWAIGVVMYIMLSGQFPFSGSSEEEYYENVINEPLEFPEEFWEGTDPVAQDLVRGLLEKDPAKRLTPEQALQHKWLNGDKIRLARTESEALRLETEANPTPRGYRFGKKRSPQEILAKRERRRK